MKDKYVNPQLKELEEWLHPKQRDVLKQRFGNVAILDLIKTTGVQLVDITDSINTKVDGYSVAEMNFPEKCEVVWVHDTTIYDPELKRFKVKFTYHLRVPKICIPLYVSAIRQLIDVPVTAYEDCFYMTAGGYRVRIGYSQFFSGHKLQVLNGIDESVKNTIEFRAKDDPNDDTLSQALVKVSNSPEYNLLLKYLDAQ